MTALGVDPAQFAGPPAAPGTVALVGGGPGDPGLVSLRAARLLSTATFVAYDRLSPSEVLVLCPPDCEQVYVGKLPQRHALAQPEINELLVSKAREGHAVVRFKGGDPFVFGRGSEEAQACVAAGVPFEVVPGVTSAVAAPAYAGIPVTHRGASPAFAVITGHEDPTKDELQVDWPALAVFPGTLVLLMAVGRLGEIAAALIAAGKDPATPVALVRWGTTPKQESLTAPLDGIGEAVARSGFASPAVAVIGVVARLRDQLTWFERRPLTGVSVLVPRTRHQAGELSERLRALGAEPVEAPTIVLAPTREPQRLRGCLTAMAEGRWEWVAFTSTNGVDAAWLAVTEMGGDARMFARTRVAAVGPGTAAALMERGLRPDLVPRRSTTEALAAELVTTGGPSSALLPRADIATPTLPLALRDAGWTVEEVEAYRTLPAKELPPEVRRRLEEGDIDVLAFASSSTVRAFIDLFGSPLPSRTRIASIGPVTSETCRELGLEVAAQADPHDLDGLVQAVLHIGGRAFYYDDSGQAT